MIDLWQRALERLHLSRGGAVWTRVQGRIPDLSAPELRGLRAKARHLRRHLDAFILASAREIHAQTSSLLHAQRQRQGDRVWQPDLWLLTLSPASRVIGESPHALSETCSLFTDCARPEIILRQFAESDPDHAAPYYIALETFVFEGSFVSLVIDLPADFLDGIEREDLITVGLVSGVEAPVQGFVRLNLQHGPNEAQMVHGLNSGARDTLDFDLQHVDLNEKRIGKVWLEVIFEKPSQNRIVLHDLFVRRRRRVAL